VQDAATKNYVDVQVAGAGAGTFLKIDGSSAMTGALNVNSHLVSNVLTPVGTQDAATKNYVDTTALLLAGGTMTGAIAMGTQKITGVGDPTLVQDAATKNYVDVQVAGAGAGTFVKIDG